VYAHRHTDMDKDAVIDKNTKTPARCLRFHICMHTDTDKDKDKDMSTNTYR